MILHIQIVSLKTNLLPQAEIAALTKRVEASGESLRSLCETVDFLGNTASTPYDCCANPDNNETRCIVRSFAAGTVTSPGTAGQCLSTDTLCNTS